MIDLDAIRARHYQTNGFVGPSGFCLCGEDWPCDAAQLVALLTPERIAAALAQGGINWPKKWGSTDLGWISRQVLAALTKEPA
jgi:hypothetical protein